MRTATIARKTNETDVKLSLALDGAGIADISTGCGFLNHMLTLFAKHGGFDLTVAARGDTDVDFHHLTEDVGIVLGQCVKEALGEGRGIARYGSMLLPMDEALVLVALDISGRAYLCYDVALASPKVGDFDTELAREFLLALCRSLSLTLHVKLLAGGNAHHVIEAVFKGLARALRQAVAIDAARSDEIPSTKGALL
ncbi:MAG: imidazoleglycerol-phosphate dehydratase HisB [Clostridiales bacterium]|jgi:imidazoleglycerol-phosphate dehydratase|nr:imidazoleglycerol-phosphate dehydratase HisB [Clostridiales bacterium]